MRTSSDKAAVSDTIQAMFSALAAGSFEGVRKYFASGFYIFDGGKRFDADGLVNLIRGAQQSGSSYRWQVTDPQVRFSGDVAWITYVNQGGVTKAGDETPVTWLESGVLQYQEGRWVILFMHSTRAATG